MALESPPVTGSKPGTTTLDQLKAYSPPAAECAATPFTVGRKQNGALQSLADVAEAAQMSFWDYVEFIFPGCDRKPRRVNWFLRYRYNCPDTKDGLNRRFVGGEVLPLPKRRSDWNDARPGIVPPIDPRHTSPDGRYDRARAARFAIRHAYNPHPYFPPLIPADCTGFASQCLLAGGWPMVFASASTDFMNPTAWWYHKGGGLQPDPVDTAIYYWSKKIQEALGSGAGPEQGAARRIATYTWGGVQNLYWFLLASRRAEVVSDWRQLQAGDVLQLHRKSDGHPHHSMFAVERVNGDLKLAQHTEGKIQWLIRDGVMARNAGDNLICLKMKDRFDDAWL